MQCIDNQLNILGESPLWDYRDERLYWVDIESKRIHGLDIESGTRFAWSLPSRPGSLALHHEKGLLVALSNELAHFCPDSGDLKTLKHTHVAGPVRFNDGKCDAKGRFWIGTMALNEKDPVGVLYCLDQGKLVEKDREIIISNGLGWSPDQKTMYFTDSPRRILYRYEFDLEEGTIAHRTVFAQVPENAGYPDGLCVDQEGYVWSAHFMGGRVTRYAPDGTVDQVFQVPALCPTSCCIGGKNGNQLFVTTATRDLTAAQKRQNPLNGGVFMLKVGVKGSKETAYKL